MFMWEKKKKRNLTILEFTWPWHTLLEGDFCFYNLVLLFTKMKPGNDDSDEAITPQDEIY